MNSDRSKRQSRGDTVIDVRLGAGALAVALATSACVTRPCICANTKQPPPAASAGAACGAGAAGRQAATPAGAMAQSGGTDRAGATPKPPVKLPGKRTIVWDGEDTASRAKGWADCEKKPDCKAQLAMTAGVGVANGNGLTFHGEGAGWVGCGWNLFGWWPADAGLDITPFKSVRLTLRIAASSPEAAPDLKNLNVHLVCSSKKSHCTSAVVNLAKLTNENLLDGNWHEIGMPVSALTANGEFDPKSVWEIDIDTWSQSAKAFDLFIDDIALGD